mmetsp:Transcript_28760/g.41179  ORF Transcript_28760/g.41179 Transcript_28760/m.41179 type:complete len:673 (+) Transcript_28760:37-2055(+)
MSRYESKGGFKKGGFARAYYGVDDDYGIEDQEDDYLDKVYDPNDIFVDADDDEIERAAEEASRAARRLQIEIAKQDKVRRTTTSSSSSSWNTLRARCCSKRAVVLAITIVAIVGVLIVLGTIPLWATSSSSASSEVSADETFVSVQQIVIVPKAPAEMESACSVTSDGAVSDLAECQRHCSLGMCCLATKSKSCFVSNSDTCPDYEVCSVLEVGKSPGSLGEILLPAPKSILHYCSEQTIANSRQMCESLCQPALCCIGADGDCSSQKQSCDSYNPCHNVWPSNVVDDSVLPSPMETICKDYNSVESSSPNSICDTACRAALCCFTGSCQEKNAVVCAQYQACPDSISKNSNNNIVPKPPQVLEKLCAEGNSPEGLAECAKECSAGACCFEKGTANCYATNEDMCRRYQPCFNVPAAELPDPVELVCSPEMVATEEGRATCTKVCSAAKCCIADGVESCYEFNEEMCDQYHACSILTTVPEAPEDLFDLCCSEDLSKCSAACEKASCCFDEGPGSCLSSNEMTCEAYNICHDKLSPSVHQLSPIASVCSSYSLKSVDGRVGCRQECEPAKCCVAQEGSCADQNKELCELYVPFCSKIWSGDEKEGDVDSASSSTIARICSIQSIATESGRAQCEEECLHAACCDAEGAFSCLSENKSWCKEFSSACKILEKP